MFTGFPLNSNELVSQVGSLSWWVTPLSPLWLQYLRTDADKPHTVAAILLGEIVNRYQPIRPEDEEGHPKAWRKRFSGDLMRLDYDKIGEKWGYTRRQIEDAAVKLRKSGLISIHIRVTASGPKTAKLSAATYVEPHVENIYRITRPDNENNSNTQDVNNPSASGKPSLSFAPGKSYRYNKRGEIIEVDGISTAAAKVKAIPPRNPEGIEKAPDTPRIPVPKAPDTPRIPVPETCAYKEHEIGRLNTRKNNNNSDEKPKPVVVVVPVGQNLAKQPPDPFGGQGLLPDSVRAEWNRYEKFFCETLKDFCLESCRTMEEATKWLGHWEGVYDQMLKYGIQEKKAIEFLTRDPYGVENKLAHLRANAGSIHSPSGWLITALKQNWQFSVAAYSELRVGQNNYKPTPIPPGAEAAYNLYLLEIEEKVKQQEPEKYAKFAVWMNETYALDERLSPEEQRLSGFLIYFCLAEPIKTPQILFLDQWVEMQAKSQTPGFTFAAEN
jgi:hypothetical protein